MEPNDFLDDENWHGGYYELAIDLGERSDATSDSRLSSALRTLWTSPHLTGCYLDRWKRPEDQLRIEPQVTDLAEPSPLYGFAQLPQGQEMVCAAHIIREMTGSEQGSHDWLDLCLPLGALSRLDHRVGGYPIGDEELSLAWRRPIDEWLVDVAVQVHEVTRFRAALIGFEVSGTPLVTEPSRDEERWITLVAPEAEGVEVHFATR